MNWKRTAICLAIASMTVMTGSGLDAMASTGMPNSSYRAHFTYDIGDIVNAKNFRGLDEKPITVSFIGRPSVLVTMPYGYNKQKIQYLTQLEKKYGSQMNFYFLTKNTGKYFQDSAKPFLGDIEIVVCNSTPYADKESINLVDKDGILRYRLPMTLDDSRIQEKFKEVLTEPRPLDVKERQQLLDKEIVEQNKAEAAFRIAHSTIPEDMGMLYTPMALDGVHIGFALAKNEGNYNAEAVKIAKQAYLAFAMGDKKQAFALANTAISKESGDALLYSLRGFIYSSMGQWEAASQDLTKAIAMKSDYAYYLYLQDAAIAGHLGQYTRVADDYMNMYEATKSKNKPVFMCASLYIKGQQADKGLELFRKHLAQDPRASQYIDYGLLNMAAGRYDAALQNYNIAQQQFETYVGQDTARRNRLSNFEGTLYKLKAVSEYNLKQYDAARTDIDKAIDIKPAINTNYGVRAMINDASGKKEAVDADLAKAFPKAKKVQAKQ